MKKRESYKRKISSNEFNDFFKTRNQLIKSPNYNNRISSTKPNSINLSTSKSKIYNIHTNNPILSSQNQEKNNKEANNTMIKNKTKKSSVSNKMLWPKLTRPKWPFSIKLKEPKELIKARLSSATPSEKYHNYNTIRWLNQKYSDSVKQKSIFSLLPNKGKVVIHVGDSEKSKRHRKIVDYLESFRAPKEREKNVEINPKYFYNKKTFERIKKMKEMFLTFDKQGNQKLLLKELAKLFKNNGIDVEINELKDLFFKNIVNINKKNIPFNLLYVDFYQFMTFALTRDQDFRYFIRKLLKKTKAKHDKKDLYFPINFNSALDFFMNKEKQTNSINAVQNAIKSMNKMMRYDNDDNIEKSNLLSEELSLSRKSNNAFLLSSKSNKKLSLRSKYTNFSGENNYNDINFYELINEFSNLFGIDNSDKSIKKNKREAKSAKSRNTKQIEQNISFTDKIKDKLKKDTLRNLNLNNFKRYNNLRLALEATKEQVKYMELHKNKFGLTKKDKQTYDMVDIKDIINQNNLHYKTPKEISKIKNAHFFDNNDNSLSINAYLDNRNKNKEKKNKSKIIINNKRHNYNFYCGSPIIVNKEYTSNSKYDFVPLELFSESKMEK